MSKKGQKYLLKHLSSAFVEKNGATYYKQKFWICFSNFLFDSVLS